MGYIRFAAAAAAGGGAYYATRKSAMPKSARTGIVLASTAVGYFASKPLETLITPNAGKALVTAANTEAQQILKNNAHLPTEEQIHPSYTLTQYKTYADKLFTAMDGAGTDLPAITDVMNAMENDLDVLALIDAFGTRAGTSWFASSTPDDLGTWLAGDGATETANNALATKANVTKRF